MRSKLLMLFLSLFMVTACTDSTVADRDIAERISESEAPVINWGVKYDTNLFGYYNVEHQEVQGFDIDIAKEITKRLTNGKGKANFIEVTSKTRIPLLKNGNIDAIIATMTISEERAKTVDFSMVYYDAGQDLLVPDGSDITSVKDLGPDHTVLAVKGSTSAKNIREHAPQSQVLELENYSECFTALKSGQGDCMTTDNAILLGIMDNNPGYHITEQVFTNEPYGIALNKDKQKPFLALVNQSLEDMKADGTYDEIYDRWFGHLVGDFKSKEGAN